MRPGPVASPAGVMIILALLAWTLAFGLILGVKAARPEWAVASLPMPIVQPLHTLGAIGFVVCGVAVLMGLTLRRASGRWRGLPAAATVLLGVFAAAGAAAILLGHGSGLEYTSWPAWLTPLPLVAFGLLGAAALANLRRLSRLSAEGTWLLIVGLTLAPAGMIERVLGDGPDAPVARALTIEWHALDTIFAGFNTALYGLAVLLTATPGRGRRLRALWLYGLSTFALLSTFGHHHYLSPQPGALKITAFVASMLGVASFLRHSRALRRGDRSEDDSPAAALFRSAKLWTVFAVGSGILLAVPQVNLVLHGTHAIVGHAMGAMIGVNVMIVLGSLIAARAEGEASDTPSAEQMRRLVRRFDLVLALFVATLLAAGITKGVMRMEVSHREYQDPVRWMLAPLPVLGAALTLILGQISLATLPRRRRGDRPEVVVATSARTPEPEMLEVQS